MLLLVAFCVAKADDTGTPVMLIEPKFMKAPVSAPIPGAKKSEFVAALVIGTEVNYATRAQFDALKLDWDAFAAQSRTAANDILKHLTTDYVRDRKKVILYATVRSPGGLIAPAVLAEKFADLFKDTLGDKLLVTIPNRTTAYIFPALASRYQEYSPLIFAAYRDTPFPVSTEVFELSKDGFKAVGAFEEP